MNQNKPKKYKGIKFLKVEQQQFMNAKRYSKNPSFNSSTINENISLTDNIGKKSFKSLLKEENTLKIENNKTIFPRLNKSNKNNNIYYSNKINFPFKMKSQSIRNILNKKINSKSKLNSPNKINSRKKNEIIILKKSSSNKGEMLLSLFPKDKMKPLKHINKNIFSDINKKILSNKSIIINSNIEKKNAIIKMKSDKSLYSKSRINYNDINNNDKENNTNYCTNDCINKNKKGNNQENENIKENKKNSNNFKKIFCCL